MIEINCRNENPAKEIKINKVLDAVKESLEFLGLYQKAGLNIVFVSSARIRVLNRRYLGVDGATDVIAFGEGPCQARNSKRSVRDIFLGDIAISSDRAMVNSRKYRTSYEDEILRYVVHGTLHLAGYKDYNEKDRRRMERIENDILERLK